jgi:4-alpha-glucanotransferase
MRQAGVLIPLFSIRTHTGWGVGEIPDLAPFARWAGAAGFRVVQVLPVMEVSRGQQSPYAALTAFALDPVYLALDAVEDFEAAGGRDALGAEDHRALDAVRGAPAVQWDRVRALKRRALQIAFERFRDREWRQRTERARELTRFAEEHASWLADYALFVTLHDERFGGRSWMEWDDAPLRRRDPQALDGARAALADRILYHEYVQWQLDRQWHAARSFANSAGVELMGDLPFMVAGDSADVWSRPFDFSLDARVGVPPDMFSATGQDWGLPVYRWDVMEGNGFAWFTERARRNADLYGLSRVDHVVGLYRTYYRTGEPESEGTFTPEGEAAQTRNGERVIGIFAQGARVIAEDLGVVPDFVRASLTRIGVPGYRVLRWEREWKEPGQPYRDPAAWPALSVATSGTHDTDSLADWWESLDRVERAAVLQIPGLAPLRERAPERFDEKVRDAFLEVLYGAGSDLVLLPLQDVLGLRERVNVPGTVTNDNWTYRMSMELQALAAELRTVERLRGLAARSGRRDI